MAISIVYGKTPPTSTTAGTYYKDLSTDTLYVKVEGIWTKKVVYPKYPMLLR